MTPAHSGGAELKKINRWQRLFAAGGLLETLLPPAAVFVNLFLCAGIFFFLLFLSNSVNQPRPITG